jgi:hypothetical protein
MAGQPGAGGCPRGRWRCRLRVRVRGRAGADPGPRAGGPAGLFGPAGPPVCGPGRGGWAGAGARAGHGVHGQLPGRLAVAVREHARESGRTISAVVAQALEEFLARGRRDHPGR